MSKTYRLTAVNGTYYYRRRVPDAYASFIGKKEIKDSLSTKSLKEAGVRRALKDVEYDALFAQFGKLIEVQKTPPLMTEAVAIMLVSNFVSARDSAAAERYANEPPESALQKREMLQESTEDWVSLADPRFLQQQGIDSHTLDSVMDQVAYRFDQSVYGYSQFYDLVVRGLRELSRREMARLQSDYKSSTFDHLFANTGDSKLKTSNAPLSQRSQMTLGELADYFIVDYQEEAPVRGTSQKTIDGIVTAAEFVKESVGTGVLTQEIGYEHCKEFQRLLSRTPANRKKVYPGLSIKEAADQAEQDGRRLMAHDTQVTYLRTLTMILKHGVKVGVLTQVPSEGMSPLAKRKKPAEKRRPFTSKELRSVFDAPLYRGCVDDGRHYAKQGPNVIRRARFWFPLIALYTGMRANEIAQLKVVDLKPLTGGGFYFDVNDLGGKKVKTQASKRAFPVHPELVKLGLLDHAEEISKLGNDGLFPELKKGSYGYMSDRIADWFSDGFLPKVVKKDGLISFHSFRHNFRDALREAEAPDFVLRELGGWSVSKGVSDNYGSGHKPEQLMEHVEKIAYPDLDLSHLYVKQIA
ncbi:MAG: site-specific integrase [Parvibaculum sp.]